MRIIIAGSRYITDYELVKSAIEESGFNITEVVSGMAPGVDSLGERWADENGIKRVGFQADWKTFGKAAGPKRNEVMANYAHGLIAVWDGRSPGTKDMIDRANRKKLLVYIKDPTDYKLNKFFDL